MENIKKIGETLQVTSTRKCANQVGKGTCKCAKVGESTEKCANSCKSWQMHAKVPWGLAPLVVQRTVVYFSRARESYFLSSKKIITFFLSGYLFVSIEAVINIFLFKKLSKLSFAFFCLF